MPPGPPLTVPGYSGTPKVSKPKEAPGADAVKERSTTSAAGASTAPATTTQTGTAADAAAPAATTTSTATAATPSGAPARNSQFQQFCANNPGAC